MSINAVPTSTSTISQMHSRSHAALNTPQILVLVVSLLMVSLSSGYFLFQRCKRSHKPSSDLAMSNGERFESPDIESKAAISSDSAQAPSKGAGQVPTLLSTRGTQSSGAPKIRSPLKIQPRQQFELLPVAINPATASSPIAIPGRSRSRSLSPSLIFSSSPASSTNSSPSSSPRTTTNSPFAAVTNRPRPRPRQHSSCASFESSYSGPGVPMSGTWDGSDSFGRSFKAIPVQVALQKRNEEIVASTSLIKLPAKAHFEPLAQKGDDGLDGSAVGSVISV